MARIKAWSFDDRDAPGINWASVYLDRYGEAAPVFINKVREFLRLDRLPGTLTEDFRERKAS